MSLGEMLDTSEKARRFYYGRLAGLSGPERLGLINQMVRGVRAIAAAGIRSRFPDVSDGRLRYLIAERSYGAEAISGDLQGRLLVSAGNPAGDDVTSIALRVARVLESEGIEYMVGGSIASGIYGEPRSTQDIDVAVRLPEASIHRVVERLGPDFAVDEEMLREAARTSRGANIFFLPTFMKIDFFARGRSPYDEEEFSRRTAIEPVPGERLFASSVEDNLLWKLRWFRMGGEVSDQQWRDVLGILRISGPVLDLAYLRRWATEHRVGDLLERALQQAAF